VGLREAKIHKKQICIVRMSFDPFNRPSAHIVIGSLQVIVIKIAFDNVWRLTGLSFVL